MTDIDKMQMLSYNICIVCMYHSAVGNTMCFRFVFSIKINDNPLMSSQYSAVIQRQFIAPALYHS